MTQAETEHTEALAALLQAHLDANNHVAKAKARYDASIQALIASAAARQDQSVAEVPKAVAEAASDVAAEA